MATKKSVHPPQPPSPPQDLHYDLQVCDVDVRRGVAGNPNTPADALAILDTDPHARSHVAENPNTPADALTTLATDPEVGVRTPVAGNPTTPASVLATLATDKTEPSVIR